MDKERSVFDRLDSIEKTLNDKADKKDFTISDMIGEPFDKYMDSSKVYYYEPDERKFQNHRKTQIKKHSIFVAIYSLILLLHIIVSFVYNVVLPYLYIGDLVLIAFPVFNLLYSIKQTSKKPAESKWNIRNHRFYIYDKKLGEEDSNGLLSKLLLAYKIISYLLFIVSVFPYLFNSPAEESLLILIISHYVFVLLIMVIHFRSNHYYLYRYYIFDKADSYVITNGWDWKKIQK